MFERIRTPASGRRRGLLLALAWLTGCSHAPPSLVPLHDAPVNDLSRVARLHENTKHPLLLRGLDGRPLDTLRVPSAFSHYDYVVQAGRHRLWLKSMPYGHPFVPQRVRCYVIDAEFAGGMRYLLEEDTREASARLLRDDTGEPVASGRMIDETWVFSGSCSW